MTILSNIGIFLKRKINLYERKILMQASGSISKSGILNLMRRIIKTTLLFEGIGALLLATRFIPVFGFGKGIYFSIFHAISAFCNAGFDLMGGFGDFASLTPFVGDYVVNLTIMLLIIAGGLGFLVWSNIIDVKLSFKKMHLHTKIVLSTTLLLIVIPAFLFFLFEKDNPNTLGPLSLDQKILASFFQSVTTRTAGFNTIDNSQITASSTILTIFLMAIGGSPGSTAGGIKTTTFVVAILSIIFASKERTTIVIGKKQLENNLIKQASAIITLFLFAIIFSSIIILAVVKDVTLSQALYETTSAMATVGMSNGIDVSSLSILSRLILIMLMYIGRIGVISIVFIFNKKDDELLKRPTEKILIG